MSPTHDFKNIGEVLDFEILKGKITELDSATDTCKLTLQDTRVVPLAVRNDITALIYYHCAPSSIVRSNGAIEGGAAGFQVDDEVIVMINYDDSVVKVIGHINGIKSCGLVIAMVVSQDGGTTKYYNCDTGAEITEVVKMVDGQKTTTPPPSELWKYLLYNGAWNWGPVDWETQITEIITTTIIDPLTGQLTTQEEEKTRALGYADKKPSKSMEWIVGTDNLTPPPGGPKMPQYKRNRLLAWDEYIDTDTSDNPFGIPDDEAYAAAYNAMPNPPFYYVGTVGLSVNNVSGFNNTIREYLKKTISSGEEEEDLSSGSSSENGVYIANDSWTYTAEIELDTRNEEGVGTVYWFRTYTTNTASSKDTTDSSSKNDRISAGDGKFFGRKIDYALTTRRDYTGLIVETESDVTYIHTSNAHYTGFDSKSEGYTFGALMYGIHKLRDATSTSFTEEINQEYSGSGQTGGQTIVTALGTWVSNYSGDEYAQSWQMGNGDDEFVCAYNYYKSDVVRNSTNTDASGFPLPIGSWTPEPVNSNEYVTWIAFRTLAAKAAYDVGAAWIEDYEDDDLIIEEGIIQIRISYPHGGLLKQLSVCKGCDCDTHFVVLITTSTLEGYYFKLLFINKTTGKYEIKDIEDGTKIYLTGLGNNRYEPET